MIDRARVFVKAGDGGDGVVHFRREKFIPKGGPDGGDGGRGGSVFIETDTNLSTLEQFAYKQKFVAESGKPGAGKRSSGLAADDLVIKVPVGTLLHYEAEGQELKEIDMDKPGMKIILAKGGKGGRGNWHFKSSTNTTPREAEPGTKGMGGWLELELKLLADVGLIGLPNVGKSTLLSVLSAAKPKIADYEFTTLEPNLGVMKSAGVGGQPVSLIIADIPGLIEGASKGKGLGIQFLQHIERTRALVHVLAVKSEEEVVDVEVVADQLWKNYQTVREELMAYEAALVQKEEIVVLNKTDLLDSETTNKLVEMLADKGIKILPISCGNMNGISDLKKKLERLVGGSETSKV